jgi:hypothetical protein
MAGGKAIGGGFGDPDYVELEREYKRDLRPRDHIDLQSFLWVQESDEYEQ